MNNSGEGKIPYIFIGIGILLVLVGTAIVKQGLTQSLNAIIAGYSFAIFGVGMMTAMSSKNVSLGMYMLLATLIINLFMISYKYTDLIESASSIPYFENYTIGGAILSVAQTAAVYLGSDYANTVTNNDSSTDPKELQKKKNMYNTAAVFMGTLNLVIASTVAMILAYYPTDC